MPIKPKYANVIVFFGGDSLNHLESMLRYYSTILSEDVWQNFLFILATPNGQSVSMLPTDIPKHIRSRCCDGCADARTMIYQDTALAIHRMYRDGMLNLHLICDDFASALFPAQAPAMLTQIIRDVTHINIMPYYYLVLHARDTEKTSRQRQLLQRLYHDEQNGAYQYPYFLSIEQDDYSLTTPESLWRALMCEILVISSGRRFLQHNVISSLGYTSLNANEKELVNLRRQHLLELMQAYCSSPYSDTAAWQDLLKTNDPMPDRQNTTDAASRLRHWLQNRIRQDMISPAPYQISNFRSLTGALSLKEPDTLVSSAKRFFEMNLRYKNAAQDKRPEYASAERYCAELLVRLSARHNLCSFPIAVIDLILHSLRSLLSYRPSASVPVYPQESILQKTIAQQHRKYMLQCCAIAEEAARTQIEESLVPVYAKAYGEMFFYVRKLLTNAASIHAEISKLMISPNAFAQLQRKYPQYRQDVVKTLSLCQEALFGGMRFYQPGNVAPDAKQLKNALKSADTQLLNRMSFGFRSSFISAITHEFSSSSEMETFLGNYLSNGRRMFHNIHEPTESAVVMHFSNDQLASTNWAAEHRDNTFFVKNDNVERLDYFSLKRKLKDYLSDENRQDPHNEFFWQMNPDEDIVDLPNAPADFHQAVILPDAKPAQDSAVNAQSAAGKPNTDEMRLLEDQGRSLLTWEWDPAIPFYEVRINSKSYPIHQAKYGANHGMVLDGLLRPGKNIVELFVLNGEKIAEQSFRGPQTYLDYKRTANALYTAYVPEAVGSIVVRETFYTRSEQGKECASHFYYPLAACDPPRGKSVVCYEGLSFSGSWDLISDPQDPFCRYAPRQNTNLSVL